MTANNGLLCIEREPSRLEEASTGSKRRHILALQCRHYGGACFAVTRVSDELAVNSASFPFPAPAIKAAAGQNCGKAIMNRVSVLDMPPGLRKIPGRGLAR